VIGTIALIARKAGTSRDAFRDHYEDVHAPLALPLLGDGLRHYVRNHVREVLAGRGANFDVLSEFGYAGSRDLEEVGEMLASERGKVILDDEQSFMDKASNTYFGVQLLGRSGSPPDPSAGSFKLALLGSSEEAMRAIAALESGALASERFACRDVGQGRAFEGVGFQWRGDAAAALEVGRAAAASGPDLVCLRVSEHVSKLNRGPCAPARPRRS